MASVTFDLQKCMQRFSNLLSKAQFKIDSQIAKDTDKYVPFRTGNLARSVTRSVYGSGRLVYDTPYARACYENVKGRHFRTNRHPNATDHWFEEAKKQHKEQWLAMVGKVLTE